jgi:hypothetical protein
MITATEVESLSGARQADVLQPATANFVDDGNVDPSARPQQITELAPYQRQMKARKGNRDFKVLAAVGSTREPTWHDCETITESEAGNLELGNRRGQE